MVRNNSLKVFFEDALPALEALIYDELESPPDGIPQVFNVESSGSWGMQDLTYAGLEPAQETEEGEEVPEDSPIEGYSKTYTFVEYTLMTSFTQSFIEDDRLNIVKDTYKSLGTSAYQCRQIVAFNTLNDAFSTTGPDGATLCATSHTMIGGHTYANRPSTDIALSIGGLQTMTTSMRRQVNHRNLNVYIQPSTIVIPPDVEQTAMELDKSDGRPDTPNRAANIYQARYKWVISPFLTSTTAWFGLANKHYLKFINRIMPETDSWYDRPTRTANTMIRQRFDVGWSDYVGVWGTSG